jgi:hypothetical protein
VQWWTVDHVDYEHNLRTVQNQLDEVHFSNAWAAGQQLSLEDLAAEALAVALAGA